MARGEWPGVTAKIGFPAVLGHEAVGRVVEKGSKVASIDTGQRVGVGWLHSTCGECEHCNSGSENICTSRTVTSVAAPGGYAEYMRIRATHALAVPDSVAPELAAPLFCAGLTVFHACRQADLYSGQRVAIFGVGGLGHLAIQLAVNAGCEVIAVDVSEKKLDLARKLGVTETVLTSAPEAVAMLKIDGGPHVAMVTSAAKAAYDLAFKTLRRRGTLMVVGLPKEDLTFFADDLVVSECRIIGSAVGTRAEMRELLALAAAGKIKCEVETVRLDQVQDVYARMTRGELTGRAVIKM
jgi:propanol-preferring alcohol dehydrogenase